MAESLRASVERVVVLPTASPANSAVTGSYKNETDGLIGGMAKGSEIGRGVGTDVGGIPVRIPIPILTLPGALIGGVAGASKKEVQDFRDRLTKSLAEAASQPLSNDALASDVFWSLRNKPGLDSKVMTLTAPVPEDTDAILYVSLVNVAIDVQGDDAIITTTADATLRRLSDGTNLYEKEVQYQDRDTLGNWTENDNALWRDYANFARHYIGREISAEIFERVDLRHELRPTKSDGVKQVKKNEWHGVSRSPSPTLGWELSVHDDNAYGTWPGEVDESDIFYDIEIYDMHRPVYSAKGVPEPRHRLTEELETCKTYRWSVRPSYHVDGDVKYGEWMRFEMDTDTGKGSIGIKASEAPAYIQDFALLDIRC